MRKKQTFFRITLALFLAAALSVPLFLVGRAVWNEEQAVHIDPREIEPSTLIVGTHLIHLSALNDSIYEVAERSAEESGQNGVYYKSELAAGAWFDISSANSLEDITTAGSPVEDSVIAALFFTHHTKSDGVTYDLRTNLAVDIRDIYNPYDLEAMEELFPLKNHYDLLRETQAGSKAGKAKIERIAFFFSTVVINETTIELDTQLASLQVYAGVLREYGGGSAEQQVVQEVMDAVDAGRRAAVFSIVEEALAAYLEELSTVSDTEDAEGNTSEGSMPDTNLQSAVSDSLNNVRASKIECEGTMLSEGPTVTTRVRYTLSNSLIQHAKERNHSSCDADVEQLVALNHIADGVLFDKDAELALLDGSLIPQATSVYTGALRRGKTANYDAAVAQNAATVLLNSIIEENTSLLNSYRNELEFFISAKTERQGTADATAFLEERLALTQGWYGGLPSDAFQAQASSTVDSHIEYLTQCLRSLELAAGGNELDALIAQKDELEQEMMSCLDKNDLEGAKALEEQIAAASAQIEQIAHDTAAQINSLNEQIGDLSEQLSAAQASGDGDLAGALEEQIGALKGEIAQISAAMGEGSLGAQVSELKKDALAAIQDGDAGAAVEYVETLGDLLGLDYGIVFPALQDLHRTMAREKNLNGNTDFDGALSAIEDAILNHEDAYAAAMRAEHTASGLAQIAEDFFAQEDGLLKPGSGLFGSGLAGTGGAGVGGGRTGTGGAGAGAAGAGAGESGTSGAGTGAGGAGTGSGGAGAGTGAGSSGIGGGGTGGSLQIPGSGRGASVGDYISLDGTGGAGTGSGGTGAGTGGAGTGTGGEGSGTGGAGAGTGGGGAETGGAGTGTDGAGAGTGGAGAGTGGEGAGTGGAGTGTGGEGSGTGGAGAGTGGAGAGTGGAGAGTGGAGAGTGGTGAGTGGEGTGTGGAGAGTGGAGTDSLFSTGGVSGGNSGIGAGGSLSSETVNQAVSLIALQMYYIETGNQDALTLLSSFSQQQASRGNPLIFLRFNDAGREYLPLSALSAYTGMRCVWNRTLNLGTLARGAVYYGFTAYSDLVKRSRLETGSDRMTQTAKFQNGVIHIFEEYTYQEFGVEAIYLSGSNYGVLCSKAYLEEALSLFAAFLE